MIDIGNIYSVAGLVCDIIGYAVTINSLGETIKSSPTVVYADVPIVYKPVLSFNAVAGTQASQNEKVLEAHLPIKFGSQSIDLTTQNKIRINGVDYSIVSMMTMLPHNFYKVRLVK